MPSLIPDSLIGRNVDLLGKVQQVNLDISLSGTSTQIFQTNNTDYRGQSIFVAYIVIESGDGLAFPANVAVGFGSSGTRDWLGVGAPALNIGGQASPVVAWCYQTAAPNSFGLPLYGPQVSFVVTNLSGATYAQLGTFSCYGWAFG